MLRTIKHSTLGHECPTVGSVNRRQTRLLLREQDTCKVTGSDMNYGYLESSCPTWGRASTYSMPTVGTGGNLDPELLAGSHSGSKISTSNNKNKTQYLLFTVHQGSVSRSLSILFPSIIPGSLSSTMCARSAHTTLQPHEPWPTRLLSPWDFPGKNAAVGCHFLLQGIFPTQRSNLQLLHCRRILYHWATWEHLVRPS